MFSGGSTEIMSACIDVVLPYVRERQQFKAIHRVPARAGQAGRHAGMNASKAYLYNIARACDRGGESRKDAAAVTLYTAEMATKIALDTIQLPGGNGYTNKYPAGRLLRDAKPYEIDTGASEIRRMLTGREQFNETK